MSYNHIYSHKKRPTFLLKSVDSSAHATGRDKTKDKTLNAFKAKRKAKDEKKRTCVNSPKQRSSSPMDMEMSDSDSEDGQFSKVDQEDERLFGKLKSAATEPAVDMPMPLTSEHLQTIMLTRSRSIRRRPPPPPPAQAGVAPAAKLYKLSSAQMDINDVLARKRQLAGQGTATERSRSGGMTTTRRDRLARVNKQNRKARWCTARSGRPAATAEEGTVALSRENIDLGDF
ncbi:hypothetical protein FB451DRAFT_1390538 [Mycena latifolia]|nr:hypothetical protein FB451DRAFT_1390538 [Mycena latifolia]